MITLLIVDTQYNVHNIRITYGVTRCYRLLLLSFYKLQYGSIEHNTKDR